MANTLPDYRSDIKTDYNIPADNTAIATDTQLNRWIEESRQEIWNIFLQTDQNYGIELSEITVTSGTQLYSLPSDFRKATDLVWADTSVIQDMILNFGAVGITGALSSFSIGYENWTLQGNKILIRSNEARTITLVYKQNVKTFAKMLSDGIDAGDYTEAGDNPDTTENIEDTFLPDFSQNKVKLYVMWKIARRQRSASADYFMKDWYQALREIKKDARRIMIPLIIGDSPE
ncbi:MAG TPA: hypothetical protein ENH82_10475 [bacterium]|nr:hypothetical protein [bacterium]